MKMDDFFQTTLSNLGLNVETLHKSIYPWALHVAGSESWLPRVHLVTHQSLTHAHKLFSQFGVLLIGFARFHLIELA